MSSRVWRACAKRIAGYLLFCRFAQTSVATHLLFRCIQHFLCFGGSILEASGDVVQKLARLALKDDAFAVLNSGVRAGDCHNRTCSQKGV